MNDYTTLRDSALNELKAYMDSLDETKGAKLAYWVKDYVHLLQQEANFQPRKLIRYKRGSIVKVHLGYRIGSEEGGLHYAVVMDSQNAMSSPVLTVIPLTSIKPGFDISKMHHSNVHLGNEVYDLLNDTFVQEITVANQTLTDHSDEWTSGNLTAEQKQEINNLRNQIIYCKRMLEEIKRMKQGSIALVGQITTVSKLRVYDPRYPNDALSNIRLSSSSLDALDKKVQELFGPNTAKKQKTN